MFKKAIVHMKKGMKLFIILTIAVFIILSIVSLVYKPTYAVYIDGVQVGYTEDKTELQSKINELIEAEDKSEENVAYVQVDSLPEYELCLLKKDIVSNDEEIFEDIKKNSTEYYRYYAILNDNEEKYYVSSFAEAEKVVADLTEKESDNIDEITIVEKYETEMKDLTTVETVVADLYVEKPQPVVVATTTTTSRGYVSASNGSSSSYVELGVSLIRPTSGVMTVGWLGYAGHTAIDLANSTGTAIVAAGSGVVTYSGYKGSYGNFIVIDHGNGVQTYYAHCSSLAVSYGQTVSQGQYIAAMGSTGNSTGSHLHFEVRKNGVAYNPLNYV